MLLHYLISTVCSSVLTMQNQEVCTSFLTQDVLLCRTMPSPGLSFNLMDQLTFYGSYHTRPGNQAIHFVFVPLIHWTITVWLAYAPAPFPLDLPAHLDFLPHAISRSACSACTLP